MPAKKKLTKAQIKAKAADAAKRMTQGKAHGTLAFSGAAMHKAMQAAKHKSFGFIKDIPRDYSGIDLARGGFKPEYLVNGYAGIANETAYKKVCRNFLHTQPYPSAKSPLEMLAYYAIPVIDAYENRDNTEVAFNMVYQDFYGVDLTRTGWDAYQPAEMMKTKLPLQIVKGVKKILREVGVTIPKWM